MITLTAIESAHLRAYPKLLEDLNPLEVIFFERGKSVEILSYEQENLFLKVTFTDDFFGPKEAYVFAPHFEIEGNLPTNQPNFDLTIKEFEGPTITLPTGDKVYLSAPIVQGGNFSWAEATKNGKRIPATVEIEANIIAMATTMESVRDHLGGFPLTITSWYRDAATNRRVGGAPQSTHLTGLAVDFYHPTLKPSEVRSKLENWWGDLGGLAHNNSKGFTHIDARGYKARWIY